jgi:N4-gp56 family major capsid protein
MQTQVSSGSALSVKEYGVALFTQTQKKPSWMKNMTGPAPKQADAERKLKLQTQPDMPIVRVTDLSKMSGDTVSVDCVNIIGGKPVMGDRDAEGTGSALTFSSMDVKIDLATKVIDAGGKMTQQRTKHQLRGLALANAIGYMAKLESQICHTHLAGARGVMNQASWPLPLDTDPDFAEILVNTVKAPSYNRHYWVDGSGTTLTLGGAQVGSLATGDVWKLDILDQLSVILDEQELPIQSVKIADDPAANDEPMYVLVMPPRSYDSLMTASGSNLRTFQQNAWNRKSYGSKHPLFMGEVGMWRNILVKKATDFWVRFTNGAAYKYVAVGDKATGTETSTTVSIATTHAVERSLLLGAQALANCYGKAQGSDFHYNWLERKYNFERAMEIGVEAMNGKAKLRFDVPQSDGTTVATDHGVIAIDGCVAL